MHGRNPDEPTGDPPAAEHHGGHRHRHGGDPNNFGFTVWQLKDGEEKIIAERLVEIFSEARRTKSTG